MVVVNECLAMAQLNSNNKTKINKTPKPKNGFSGARWSRESRSGNARAFLLCGLARQAFLIFNLL